MDIKSSAKHEKSFSSSELHEESHFSEGYENQGSPGFPLPGDTIGPAEADLHEPCTPEPPPGPQMPGHPARATQKKGLISQRGVQQ